MGFSGKVLPDLLSDEVVNRIAKKHSKAPAQILLRFLDEVVNRIAKKHSKAPAQILLRFLLQLGVAAIPKSVTPSRIKENFNIFNFELDGQDMSDLRACHSE
ncbi:Aldo/keto reductase family [Popillia japonica]|uniref:Aldo/keto reductase family n=1 Tax=Popillia japonica TaxID=7064 RepID=A0AAW1M523_POPJA